MNCYKRDLAERHEESMPAAETIEVAEMVRRERAVRKEMFKDSTPSELHEYREAAREEVEKKQVGYVAPPVVEKSVEEQLKELL